MLDFGDRFRQLLQAHQSEQLRVNGNDDLVRRSKGVDGERAEGRAGVHQDVVIIRPERRQQLGKAIVLSLNQQVHLCHGQRFFGREQVHLAYVQDVTGLFRQNFIHD